MSSPGCGLSLHWPERLFCNGKQFLIFVKPNLLIFLVMVMVFVSSFKEISFYDYEDIH